MWVFLKLALRPWNRSPWSQLMSGSAVGLLLALGGLLFWLERGLVPVIARLDREQVLTVFVQKGETSEAARLGSIRDSIRTTLGSAQIREVSTPEFIRTIRGEYPELAQELGELGPEAETVVPSHLVVTGEMSAEQVQTIRGISGVESVDSSRDRYPQIVSAFEALRVVSRGLSFALLLAILAGVVQVSRMNAHLHADVMPILRLLGAGSFGMRAPSIFGGVFIGLMGGVFAAAAWAFFVPDLIAQLRALSPLLATLPRPSSVSIGVLAALGTLLGVLGGILGGAPSATQRVGELAR